MARRTESRSSIAEAGPGRTESTVIILARRQVRAFELLQATGSADSNECGDDKLKAIGIIKNIK